MFPSLPSGSFETWILCAAGTLSIIALVKKVFLTRPLHESEFVTRTEFHHELGGLRDNIDARLLTLSEKIDKMNGSIHERLNQLEAGLARVDERTRPQRAA
jgi:hypothetical protein